MNDLKYKILMARMKKTQLENMHLKEEIKKYNVDNLKVMIGETLKLQEMYRKLISEVRESKREYDLLSDAQERSINSYRKQMNKMGVKIH